MTKPSFVYVTYIATTPEKAWQAIVDTDVTRKYWTDPASDQVAHVNVSDWKPGSRWEHQRDDGTHIADVVGTVIECTSPRRLVCTWASPGNAEDASKRSQVTFDIEPQGTKLIRLTVTHENLESDPDMLAGVSEGWPKVLSNLKSFLETGHAISHSPATV